MSCLWQEIRHPFFWFTEEDLPRLRKNAGAPFWQPKFAAWREELRSTEALRLETPTIDFHSGANTAALKAALCFVVDGDAHFGRLVGSFLSAVAEYYRKGPDWRVCMTTNGPGQWTGNQWGGLSGNHIVDPQIWLSCGHLYDVVYGRGFLPDDDAQTFEEMMALCHQVSCLHEELQKMDNNRSVWLCAGGYLSSLFDRDAARATAVRERLRNTMFRFLDTILEDGIHYEIGPYGPATIAAMQVFARCIRGAEGRDFFHEKVEGVGMEEFYRAWAGTLVPGSSLRLPAQRDRINHWDSIGAAWREYRIPEIGWALSRMPERPWVPLFRHWPQGLEFYTWDDPGEVHAPAFRISHFPSSGIALLRTGWEAEAASLYFRYGFQGSSHGGGLDKLNIELTCNDEPLIADPMLSERSHDKNVVLVDGCDQEQCSGKLLYSDLWEDAAVQVLSAEGGFGPWPKRDFLNDPRAEVNYWCTKNDECFPGRATMRRTVALVDKRIFVVRDTLLSRDGQDHDYEWLFHTFAQLATGPCLGREVIHHLPKRRFYSEKVPAISRRADRFVWPDGPWSFVSDKAAMTARFFAFGADVPGTFALTYDAAPYQYAGSPETGDGYRQKMLNRVHLGLRGRDVALTSVFLPRPAHRPERIVFGTPLRESLEEFWLEIEVDGVVRLLKGDEKAGAWSFS